MSQTLPATTYAVLGLLTFSPRSPYELAQLAQQSIANFWSISKSQVYKEVARLEGLGWVKGEDVEQSGLPDKTVFEITEQGQEALKCWLDSPMAELDKFRSALLVKVFFGNHMDSEVFAELIGTYAREAEENARALEGLARSLKSSEGTIYAGATAALGARVTKACALWAREVEEELVKGRRR